MSRVDAIPVGDMRPVRGLESADADLSRSCSRRSRLSWSVLAHGTCRPSLVLNLGASKLGSALS